MSNDIIDSAVWLVISGIVGFVLVVLGSAIESIIISLFGGVLIAIPFLMFIIAIINEAR